MLKTNPLGCETDHPALYTLYTRVYRDSQLVDMQKERFGYRYLNWTPEGGFFPQWGGDEIPWGIPSP